MRIFYLIISLNLLSVTNVFSIEVLSPQAYMVDLQTGTVLLEKNADQKMPPSSMTKIMTAYLIFERMKSGHVKPSDRLLVSKKAWKMGGSRMFVQVSSQVTIEDLLYGAIVLSGNDACVALAEGVSESEEAFAEEMTQKAHEMGAINSNFLNASGWPNAGHVSTARDLALIAERIINNFPEEYEKYFSPESYTYNNIKQTNRNTLLHKGMADGVKTGYTEAGGYGSVVSAIQADRRLILVVNGLPTMISRDKEAAALINWGFNYFKNYKVFNKGDLVDVANVWGSSEKKVQLVSGKEIILTLSHSQSQGLKIKVIYDSQIMAPLKAGDQVGVIEVMIPDKGIKEFPLCVGKNIPQSGFFQRIFSSIYHFICGQNGPIKKDIIPKLTFEKVCGEND